MSRNVPGCSMFLVLSTPRVNILSNAIGVLHALQRIRGIGWMFVETSHEMYLLKQVNE